MDFCSQLGLLEWWFISQKLNRSNIETSRCSWANLAQKRVWKTCWLVALTGYVGVELGCEIETTPSVGVHEYVGILGFLPDHLQHTQPRRNYQNVNSW